MSLTVSASFTGTTAGAALLLKQGDTLTYSVSGTFSGTAVLEKSFTNGATWDLVAAFTAAASDGIEIRNSNGGYVQYRFRCSDYTSGTIVTSIVRASLVVFERRDRDGGLVFQIKEDGINAAVKPSQTRIQAGGARVGATAGWVTTASTNVGRMATCPASQAASTLVIPLHHLKVGDTITGFYAVGQIESAGGTVTLDIALRKLTSAAADLVDALVGSITQLLVTAETVISSTNAGKTGLSDAVDANETFYLLITASTGSLCDIDLQGVAVTVTEA